MSIIGLVVIGLLSGGLVLLPRGGGPPGVAGALAPCELSSIGSGPDQATGTYGGAFFGRSVAQSFIARDSLIRAITIWRQPDPFENQVPMHLFIGAMSLTDSLRPDPLTVLFDGPIEVLKGPSQIARPVRFELDPPWALPRVDRYFFAVKENLCSAGFAVLTDSTDCYTEGDAWQILPSAGCQGLGNNCNSLMGIDLIFSIEFCSPSTGLESPSWGGVKALYR